MRDLHIKAEAKADEVADIYMITYHPLIWRKSKNWDDKCGDEVPHAEQGTTFQTPKLFQMVRTSDDPRCGMWLKCVATSRYLPMRDNDYRDWSTRDKVEESDHICIKKVEE